VDEDPLSPGCVAIASLDQRLPSQSSTAVTHCIPIATHFTDTEGMEARIKLACGWGLKPRSPDWEAVAITIRPLREAQLIIDYMKLIKQMSWIQSSAEN